MLTVKDFEQMTKEELKKLLFDSSLSYYNMAESIISDEEYDLGFSFFNQKYPEDGLANIIGAKVSISNWEKASHNIPMSSLNKVNTVEEFERWVKTIGQDEYFIVEDKCDGISVSLEFKNGDLIKAITRGDGFIGEDIFNNVIKMKNIPRKLDNFNGSLRGEIIMLVSDFEQLNEILRSNGEKEKANPRNTAAGTSKRFDGKYCEYLTVLFYDATGNWLREEDKMNWFKEKKIETCFWKKGKIDMCIKLFNEYENHLRAEKDFDIDGLVIKANEVSVQNFHGMLGANPKAQIAWKFTSMKAETILLDIEWQAGANCRITPIAILQPVKIGGVIVRRASLHNLRYFNQLNPYKNARVLISRRGDVIPQIEKILE